MKQAEGDTNEKRKARRSEATMTLPELIAYFRIITGTDEEEITVERTDVVTLLNAAEDVHLLSEQNAEMNLGLLEYEKQLTLAREALEFYADVENYNKETGALIDMRPRGLARKKWKVLDCGDRAREALEKLK